MTKKALIAGITGQDGSYLAELLLAKGYEVHGIVRRASTFNTSRLEHLYTDDRVLNKSLFLHYGDLLDLGVLIKLISQIQPDEVYNLAAQSHVRVSFDEPVFTSDITALGTTRLLEALVATRSSARFYQASSSEMFGDEAAPQSEATKFAPRSPYAVSKLYSHWITKNYRESHGMFAVSGILFNHESPRRGPTFVTRKVSRGVAAIVNGTASSLVLGNLEARRDWGYAPEYVVAIWKMLQQKDPEDLVIGTGESISVEQFVQAAFESAGLNWRDYVATDEKYLRPTEVDHLQANAGLAKTRLGWESEVSVTELAKAMVLHDIDAQHSGRIDRPFGRMWQRETN